MYNQFCVKEYSASCFSRGTCTSSSVLKNTAFLVLVEVRVHPVMCLCKQAHICLYTVLHIKVEVIYKRRNAYPIPYESTIYVT